MSLILLHNLNDLHVSTFSVLFPLNKTTVFDLRKNTHTQTVAHFLFLRYKHNGIE